MIGLLGEFLRMGHTGGCAVHGYHAVREKIKGSGVWWVFVHHKGYKTSMTVGKDKRFALALAEKINAQLVLGDLRIFQEKVIGVKTFKEYSEQFIAITVSATC